MEEIFSLLLEHTFFCDKNIKKLSLLDLFSLALEELEQSEVLKWKKEEKELILKSEYLDDHIQWVWPEILKY